MGGGAICLERHRTSKEQPKDFVFSGLCRQRRGKIGLSDGKAKYQERNIKGSY